MAASTKKEGTKWSRNSSVADSQSESTIRSSATAGRAATYGLTRGTTAAIPAIAGGGEGVGGDSDGYTHFSQAHCPIHYQLGERGQCQPRPAAEGVALTMHCFLPVHNRPHSLLGVDNSVNGTRRPTELSLNCTGQNDYSYYSAWTVMLGGE